MALLAAQARQVIPQKQVKEVEAEEVRTLELAEQAALAARMEAVAAEEAAAPQQAAPAAQAAPEWCM